MTASLTELEYYHRRAEAQLELAQKSDLSVVVAAHVAIAERYLEYCEPIRRHEVSQRGGEPLLRPIAAMPAAG